MFLSRRFYRRQIRVGPKRSQVRRPVDVFEADLPAEDSHNMTDILITGE